MSRIAAAVMFAAVTASAALSQAPQTREIIVTGEVSLEFAPDRFAVVYQVNGLADTRAEAIAQSETVMTRIREAVPGLEGLESLEIATRGASLDPVRERECMRTAMSAQRPTCAIEAWSFERAVILRGAPAERAGSVLALAADLDITEAALERFYLSDPATARRDVEIAALADARAKAEGLAAAAGAPLGALVRLQAGENFRQVGLFEGDQAGNFNVFQRSAPSVELDLQPTPVTIRSEIVAAFTLGSAN
ncbi:MAG: SIMPL domain-containing protein [Oceanicaulis sp.]